MLTLVSVCPSSNLQKFNSGRLFGCCCTVVAMYVHPPEEYYLETDEYVQEKSYNPYYAFVAQQLCRTSHSYTITLQFCLWDFLRDLGETGVGGTEVLKNLKDDAASFDVGKISSSRSRNVARAYAWWIAKDACTLAVLKVIPLYLVPTLQTADVDFNSLSISRP